MVIMVMVAMVTVMIMLVLIATISIIIIFNMALTSSCHRLIQMPWWLATMIMFACVIVKVDSTMTSSATGSSPS